MKKQLVLLLFIFLKLSWFPAQVNLVPNPSFEEMLWCPVSLGNDGCLAYWKSCSNTPDYFNSCHTPLLSAGVPSNYYGFQQPHSGNGYSGMIVYSTNGSYREPIGCNLISPLVINQKYYTSACIAMANCSLQGGIASNNLGFTFTNANYNTANPISVNNFAHVVSNIVITDTLNWIRIIGSFTADSAYSKVLFGNFFDDQSTISSDPLSCGSGIAYYYVDDICISTDSLYTANYITGLQSLTNSNTTKIYPNPASSEFYIENVSTLPIISDLLGNLINSDSQLTQKGYKINTSDWINGVYFLTTKNKFYKIIINH